MSRIRPGTLRSRAYAQARSRIMPPRCRCPAALANYRGCGWDHVTATRAGLPSADAAACRVSPAVLAAWTSGWTTPGSLSTHCRQAHPWSSPLCASASG